MTLELQWQHDKHIKELAEHTDRLLKKFNQFTQEANARVTALNTSCKFMTVKLKREVEEAKCETTTLQDKYKKREECIHALIMKHWQMLNRKIQETLVDGWKMSSAKAAEFQTLWVDPEN